MCPEDCVGLQFLVKVRRTAYKFPRYSLTIVIFDERSSIISDVDTKGKLVDGRGED